LRTSSISWPGLYPTPLIEPEAFDWIM